jgi:hypothetical protein
MGHASNREPRRFWRATRSNRVRVPCASCGAPARLHSAALPFCASCLGPARPGRYLDGDDLATGDETLRRPQHVISD